MFSFMIQVKVTLSPDGETLILKAGGVYRKSCLCFRVSAPLCDATQLACS